MSTSLFDYIYTVWAPKGTVIDWEAGAKKIAEVYPGEEEAEATDALEQIQHVWEANGHADDHDIDYREMGDLTVLLIDGEAVSVGMLNVDGYSVLEAAGFYQMPVEGGGEDYMQVDPKHMQDHGL